MNSSHFFKLNLRDPAKKMSKEFVAQFEFVTLMNLTRGLSKCNSTIVTTLSFIVSQRRKNCIQYCLKLLMHLHTVIPHLYWSCYRGISTVGQKPQPRQRQRQPNAVINVINHGNLPQKDNGFLTLPLFVSLFNFISPFSLSSLCTNICDNANKESLCWDFAFKKFHFVYSLLSSVLQSWFFT